MRLIAVSVVSIYILANCITYYPGRVVERTDSDTTVDLSGKWNDADSRIVAEDLSAEMLTGAWIRLFAQRYGKRPAIIVGNIRNLSSEHIAIPAFIKDIERVLMNSGQTQVVASPDERIEVRAERNDQQYNAALETRVRLQEELGADFILIGTITSQIDAVVGQKVVLYQVDLELIDIESNIKTWIGSTKIKKEISQGIIIP